METLKNDFFSIITSISVLLTAFLTIYLYCCYRVSYWRRRGITQLSGTSKIFGDFKNGILFRTAPGYHMGEIYRNTPSNASFVGFYIFHKPCLLVKDPKLIKQILIKDFNVFPNRHFAGSQQKDSIGMQNLFGLRNLAWRYLRRKISPTLTQSKLKQMVPLMIEPGKPMMEYLTSKTVNGAKVIDVQEINYKFTADLISNVALGTKTDSFNLPDSHYTRCVMNFFHSLKRMVALVTVFFIPELTELVGSSVLFDSAFVRKIFWDAVKSREKSKEYRGDFINSIIRLKNGKQNSVYKFEGDNLFYQSGTFFSGFESSSTVATFTLMELAKHKAYQDRAREDIKKAIDEHGWTLEAFNEMKYLDQCIAEGVRLHPSVSTIDRYTNEDYKIPGSNVIIEKGTPIYISLYGLHGDDKFFSNPELYDPERYSNGRVVSEAYIPFGAGPRKCVGIRVGQLHVKVVISMILLEYKIYQKSDEVNKLDSRSTFTAAADGINLEFTKMVE